MTTRRLITAAVLVVTLATASGTGLRRVKAADPNTTYYAAIAYSPSTGSYGWSRWWTADINARRVAMDNCKGDDKRIVKMVGNYWLALALGDDKSVWGVGWSADPDRAKQYALEECGKRTTNCECVVLINARPDSL